MNKKILTLLIIVSSLNIDSAFAENYKKNDPKSNQIENLSSRLERLYKLHAEKKEYLQFARKSKMQIIEDRVVVTVLTKPGVTTADIDENDLKAFGSVIQAKAKHSIRVEIPISALEEVSKEIKEFASIRTLIKPEEHTLTSEEKYTIISEGVTLMNAHKWQLWDYKGGGVKIAVIDGGFMGIRKAQGSGEIPGSYVSQDFSGNGFETESSHGTAVTEAIFDLAPQAEFYLYKIGDLTGFENAKDSCISNGIDIVNHSMGWFNTGGYYDGSGYACDIATDAIDNGILWVNSAGNSAKHHYRGVFSDYGSGYHNFGGPLDTINPIGPNPDNMWRHQDGEYISIVMNWDNYASANQDYDLYLARYDGSNWTLVDSSTNTQNGVSYLPEEYINYTNSVYNGMYGILVKKTAAAEDVDFTLFSLEQSGLGHHAELSSLADPGTVTDVVTVGAINKDNYASGPQEYFSSQGPTTDGRIKPDVTAPDNCDSYTYGHWYGTSLSSPHTAGVCALIKSRYPGFSNSEIRNYLYTECTVDLGLLGKDNFYGWGKVMMPSIGEINITAPNGGENWQAESKYNIAWTSDGTSGGVRIEYSTNNGASWSDVIEIMPDTGTYPWVIPNRPSNSCLVRITDTVGTPSDTSDATFIISPVTSVPHSKSPSVYSMIVKGVTADAQFEVKYGLPEKANVRFGVYDIKGTKIKEILEEHTPGFYSTKIDMIDKPVGVYFIRMEANNKKFTKTRKVILVR